MVLPVAPVNLGGISGRTWKFDSPSKEPLSCAWEIRGAGSPAASFDEKDSYLHYGVISERRRTFTSG